MANDLLSAGVKEPICGWDWIKQHQHDLDGWTPTIEIACPGLRLTATIRDETAMDAICKAMRDNKGE